MGHIPPRAVPGPQADPDDHIRRHSPVLWRMELPVSHGDRGHGGVGGLPGVDKEVVRMKGWFFKTILIYELFAFLVWNILVRTEADFEQWAYDNIHTIAYIWWATTLLVVTLSFVIQWSLNKWRVRARIRLLKDPRKPGDKQ